MIALFYTCSAIAENEHMSPGEAFSLALEWYCLIIGSFYFRWLLEKA